MKRCFNFHLFGFWSGSYYYPQVTFDMFQEKCKNYLPSLGNPFDSYPGIPTLLTYKGVTYLSGTVQRTGHSPRPQKGEGDSDQVLVVQRPAHRTLDTGRTSVINKTRKTLILPSKIMWITSSDLVFCLYSIKPQKLL
jgi:hypothetical protein